MSQPCPCRGCTAAYKQGKEDMREYLLADDENSFAQGYRMGRKEQYDEWQDVLTSTNNTAAMAERERIRSGVLSYYKVAPLAAEPILRIIDGQTKKLGGETDDVLQAGMDAGHD